MKWLIPHPQKLISFLQGELGSYSGKFLRRLLEANLCRVNGRIERFGSRALNRGDRVELAPNWKALLESKGGGFETIYEDEFLKIVAKPAGWVCEAQNALKTFGPNHYLVHRLDKDTTGLLIIAKGAKSRDALIELFEKRLIHKSYLAIVDGVVKEGSGERRSFLAKKGAYQGQTIWGSSPHGLSAITRWKRVAVGKGASLVLCEPETGRTHQIRVHMAEMGHPILADRQYAKTFRCPLFVPRILLHAYRLQFSFQGKEIDVRAPLLLDMCDVLRNIGVQMREVREFVAEQKEERCRDQSHCDKEAEEVEKPSHLLHKPRQKAAVEKGKPHAKIPHSDAERRVTRRAKSGNHRKANRGQKHLSHRHQKVRPH